MFILGPYPKASRKKHLHPKAHATDVLFPSSIKPPRQSKMQVACSFFYILYSIYKRFYPEYFWNAFLSTIVFFVNRNPASGSWPPTRPATSSPAAGLGPWTSTALHRARRGSDSNGEKNNELQNDRCSDMPSQRQDTAQKNHVVVWTTSPVTQITQEERKGGCDGSRGDPRTGYSRLGDQGYGYAQADGEAIPARGNGAPLDAGWVPWRGVGGQDDVPHRRGDPPSSGSPRGSPGWGQWRGVLGDRMTCHIGEEIPQRA